MTLYRSSAPAVTPHHFPASLPQPESSAVSLSPPFVLCLSVSSTGSIAAGTADGYLVIGLGGDKRMSVKKTRKWGGLREDMSLSSKIADGPVVALCVVLSLSGVFECTHFRRT